MKLIAKLAVVAVVVCIAVALLRWNNACNEAARLDAELAALRLRISDRLRDHDPAQPIPVDVIEDVRQMTLKNQKLSEVLGLNDPAQEPLEPRGPDDYPVSNQGELRAAPAAVTHSPRPKE